ncbi:hypothetical protein [Natrialba sp. SSL1]|uniref:hypothetical protein n=1 Tax=Natrialba sp. SSL1 TaxID=1869245 RepID=UPI0008F90168|nr:hypothetical protein [Natrialba sp. SSL1]OIB58603.1 hypothetical protein BBD46_07155 [Natrialba sp. SSL1]
MTSALPVIEWFRDDDATDNGDGNDDRGGNGSWNGTGSGDRNGNSSGDGNNGWTLPEGRRREFVALAIGLPVFAWFVSSDVGSLAPTTHWLPVLVGVCCGFLYAVHVRDAVIDAIPDGLSGWTSLSLLSGGAGLSLLEVFHIATPTVVFILVAGGTILAIYSLRLVSPLHDGLQPARRGVEPPPALE